MKFIIKIKTSTGVYSRVVIGSRDMLMDAAYDDGAMGVTLLTLP
jgi:hypothetical protein